MSATPESDTLWPGFFEAAADVGGAVMTVKRLCTAIGLNVKSLAIDRAACRTDQLELVAGNRVGTAVEAAGTLVGIRSTIVGRAAEVVESQHF